MQFNYKNFLKKYEDKGYKSIFFHELDMLKKNQLILRHDIDLDVSYAYDMALIEKELGMKSAYFFLLSSDSYNLFAKSTIDYILKIKQMGHQISLHFDPTVYQDFEEGFNQEIKMFEDVFEVQIDIVSLHRPNDFFLNYDQKIAGIEHTYMKKYFKDIKYIADSQGRFRYDHPIENKWFENLENIQLLTHPIWWDDKDEDAIRKVNDFIDDRTEKFRVYVSENNKPYKEYLKDINYELRYKR